jgi:ankyrin repeat protein
MHLYLMRVLTPIDIQNGNAALALASCKGHVKIVKVLLEAKATINAKNVVSSTSCQSTAKAQRSLFFVTGCWSIDIQDGETALVLASVVGCVDVVKVLLEAKADVHARNDVSILD